MCVCVCGGGGVLISGSLWYSWTLTSTFSGFNVECTPNMDSNEIVWNNVDCMDIKQLLDEVEHDIMNYQNRGLCYLPKPKAEADNTDTNTDTRF